MISLLDEHSFRRDSIISAFAAVKSGEAVHKNLIPDRMYKNIYILTPEFLKKRGKMAVIFDIDNTVAPYEVVTPTPKMKAYFADLKANGIEAAFVSNNNTDRAEIFNTELGLFCVSDAGKPSPNGIIKCIEHFGIDKKNIVLVGDQIFTDCIAAHRAGIQCWLVTPIKDKETWFFKLKRHFEKPVIREYKKRRMKSLKRKKNITG